MEKSPFMFKILEIVKTKRNNFKIRTNSKSCYAISCRISGKSLFFYDNKQHTVNKGDILYIPYGASYSQECESEEIICFHLEAFSDVSDNIGIFSTDDPDIVCSLFEKAHQEWQKRGFNYKYRCMALLYEILSHAGFEENNDLKITPYNTALEYLNSHLYDTDFSISDLCERSNISRSYFNEIFKKQNGCTPMEYINSARINKAKLLLKSGNYTKEEVSSLCGFNDIKYFFVVFKKITGKTTKEYIGGIL